MSEMLTGYDAIAKAVKACNPDVIPAYPITPQTDIVQKLSKMVADGELTSEYVRVDSEFNAASTALGASAAGARIFTATCSQGLKLMSEPLFSAAGMRLPLVLGIANRSLSAPLSIWADHTDTFAERDGGMLQFYAEDVQEAADNIAMAYKVAEDPEIRLPALSCMDGFILTHVQEAVDVFDEDKIQDYLPENNPEYDLDPSDPTTMGAYARPEHWTEAKYVAHKAQLRAKDKIAEAVQEFADTFGRKYGLEHRGLIETYRTDDADVILVGIGSMCGTMKTVIDEYREKGEKVGLLKVRVYRPFPTEEIENVLKDCEAVGIVERHVSSGYQGGLAIDIKSALYSSNVRVPLLNFITGLAGRDISRDVISEMIEKTKDVQDKDPGEISPEEEEIWIPLKEELLPEGDK